jgi:hypothetical protein
LINKFEIFFELVFIIAVLCAILYTILLLYYIKIYIKINGKIQIKSLLFIFATIFVVILVIIPSYVGDFYAGELIAGHSNSLGITFEPAIMENNTTKNQLILVMYHSGNYYVVEQHDPAPEKAKLYIIQSNKVNRIITNTINGRPSISRLFEHVFLNIESYKKTFKL